MVTLTALFSKLSNSNFSGHLTLSALHWPSWWYRPPDVQHSVTVLSQWLRHVRGTACHHLSGMHRRWRRSVVSWRLYFSGRRLTVTGDRDCTAQYNCCLPATTDCRRFSLFCWILYSLVRFSSVRYTLKTNVLRGLQACLNRWVLSPARNCPRLISGDRKWAGSEFQTTGAATVKLRWLSFVILILGTLPVQCPWQGSVT